MKTSKIVYFEVRHRCQVEYNDSTLAVASHVDPIVRSVFI